jgi:hypothetical protein
MTSVCIRCGKMRKVAKTWTEYIGTSLVTYTTTVCPDEECQKIVEEQLKKRKDKLEAIHQESLERKKNVRRKRIKKTSGKK